MFVKFAAHECPYPDFALCLLHLRVAVYDVFAPPRRELRRAGRDTVKRPRRRQRGAADAAFVAPSLQPCGSTRGRLTQAGG
jgi:hypothetical protein